MPPSTAAPEDTADEQASTFTLLGKIDRCEEGVVLGWAARSDFVGERLTIELWVDGVPATRSAADLMRRDVALAGIGDGGYGFALAVPAACFDGEPHLLEVREFTQGTLLDGGPLTFCDVPRGNAAPSAADKAPPITKGSLDDCLPGGITGWVARLDGSRLALEVELLVDDVAAVRATADRHRADLVAARIGNGHHAFCIEPPDSLYDGEPHRVHVREIASGEFLAGCPVVVRFNPCQLWDRSSGDDQLRRRQLADRALAWCEAAEGHSLGSDVHVVFLRLASWFQAQSSASNSRRAQVQLDRLTALRCRLVMNGMLGAQDIGGTIVDIWADAAEPMALELLEGDRCVATTESRVDGWFVFQLPESLLDDHVHRFSVRVQAMGGVIGAWSFLLSSAPATSRRALDPIWDTVPAAMAAQRKIPRATPTAVETARLALEEGLAADAGERNVNRGALSRLTCALAHALLDVGEHQQAQARYEEAITLDPECAEALAGPIRCLMAAGDDTAARERLSVTMQAHPDERGLHRIRDDLEGRSRLRSVRTLAFYLPQFHPTPENDEWWGRGFTEWTNVTGASPLFGGHLQPRRPTSLGYYDLRLPDAVHAQFELARRYGIDGFCYYYYWFEGRRILDRPLEDLANGRTGPFPFCVCWANEDWTRSWDGTSGEVLLAQNHSPQSDFAFIQDLAPLLRHPDYVRVDGRPMVLVYRADRLATPKETVARWRAWCRAEGIGELYLCAVQSFGFNDPRPLGFDAAVEFPPHCPWDRYPELRYLKTLDELPGRAHGFKGMVYDYQAFAAAAMRRPREPFALHRTAMVAWDNTARRGNSAAIYHHFSVDTFESWVLANARRAAIEQTDAVCFVNAWNEWAEGSVLEPDVHFGYENLEATRRATQVATLDPAATYWCRGRPLLPEERVEARQRVMLIGHDAFPSGAQTNLLNMARCLKRQLDTDLVIMLIEGGELLPEYERIAPTYVIGKGEKALAALQNQLRYYANLGTRKALCNTVLTGDLTEVLKQEGYRVVGLLHEMPTLIESYGLQASCWRFAASTDAIVCASSVVADEFCNRYWPDPKKVLISPQGISFNRHHAQREEMRALVRKDFGLQDGSRMVLGCGYGDSRKGMDLFVQMAGVVARHCEPGSVAFVWVGALDAQLAPYIHADIERLALAEVFRITGRTDDPGRYFIAGDVFALTSREDPFPSVVMEAFDARMPVVAFAGGGGYVDIVGPDTGALVPYLDVAEMAAVVLGYLHDPARLDAVGSANHALCRERFGYAPYMRRLLALLADVPAEQVAAGMLQRQPWFSDKPRPTITAIVPNYNYARYLELRLRTVVGQTLQPDEIIVLDDASTDGSQAIIEAFAAVSPIPLHLVKSDSNTGNPFVQWAKGLARAKGNLIWIAEADDYCEPTLLETLARELSDDAVVMAWSDSVMVDDSGRSHGAQYKDYYARNYGTKWSTHFRMPGRELIDDCLLAENVVPNASAVLFRRSAAAFDLAPIQAYRFSGDWWFWLALARAGDVVYRADPLNYHRRHSRSVMGDVLRAGSSLLPETMGFYSRVATSMPDCISVRTASMVVERLSRLYEMFPDLTAKSARLDAHAEWRRPFAALSRDLARAIASKDRLQGSSTTLVLSQDVLSEGATGPALVGHWLGVDLATRVVVLASPDALQACVSSLDVASRRVEVVTVGVGLRPVSGQMASDEQLSAIFAEDAGGNVVTHGLQAHCLCGPLIAKRQGSWTLVGGAEFDLILGQLPKAHGVSIAALRKAVATCADLRFLGTAPPHSLARMAQESARPLERLVLRASLRHPVAQKSEARPVTVTAICAQAAVEDWAVAADVLAQVAIGLNCPIRFRLLCWGPGSDEFAQVADGRPHVELVELWDRPARFAAIADLMLVGQDDTGSGAVSLIEMKRQRIPMLTVRELVGCTSIDGAQTLVAEALSGRPARYRSRESADVGRS